MLIKKKLKRGFTLAELLIVVAIIAVLVAIALPVFGNALERAKEATCLGNRRSLKGELTTAYMLEQDVEAAYASSTGLYVCPDHGTISYLTDGEGEYEIFCSFHSVNVTSTLKDALLNLLSSNAASSNPSAWLTDFNAGSSQGKAIDSTTTVAKGNGSHYKEILEELKKQGVDPSVFSAETWSIISSNEAGRQVLMSDQDITKLPKGTKVRVLCYNIDTKESSGIAADTYTVGYAVVGSRTSLGGEPNYNVISDSAMKNGFGKNSETVYTSYDEAYSALLKEAATQ